MLAAAFGNFVAAVLAVTQAILSVFSIYHHSANVNASLFFRDSDNTTYVSTGDINAMWLRDSSVQSMSVLHNRRLVRGVIQRQERLIALDPYANAFYRNYQVAERKFEIDSLCYPVRLVRRYEQATRDRSVFDQHMYGMLLKILNTLATERHHKDQSRYHRNEHPAAEIGLIWSAYRASDDRQAYNYNIPENMFAAVTLHDMADIFKQHYGDDESAWRATAIATDIEAAVELHAVFKTTFGRIYAYEIDGRGHAKFMDDANMPSLLAIPLLGFAYDRAVYENTRHFIFNPANPYYFEGRYASGVGSAHTPEGYIWPMSLLVEYRTATSRWERNHVLDELRASETGDGVLHESFDVNDPRKFTRPRFGWVNALFQQAFAAERQTINALHTTEGR